MSSQHKLLIPKPKPLIVVSGRIASMLEGRLRRGSDLPIKLKRKKVKTNGRPL